MHPSGHQDSFTRDNLPPTEMMPQFLFELPALKYPAQLNCTEQLLDRHIVSGGGDLPAIHTMEDTWSYARLHGNVNKIAHVLVQHMGVVPGNRVLMRFPNSPLFAACLLAVMKCGAVAVPTMPLLREKELSGIIAKAEISHALCDDRLMEALEDIPLQHVLSSKDIERLMAGFSEDFTPAPTASDDVALIGFTSGTSGDPKGVLHYHRDVMSMCHTFCAEVLKPKSDDVFIGSPPLAFTFGLGGLLAFPLYAGASTVLLESPAPKNLAAAIKAIGATICFTAPTAYKVLLSDADAVASLSSLRLAVSAGEHLPKPVYEQWLEQTGISMIDGIGATEMIHIFLSMTSEGDKAGSTGRPVPGYELCILDADMQEVAADTEGFLAVRGPTGCKYLADDRQQNYVRDGWNITGDIFRKDVDGHYWYVARSDDMIISAGYNISGPEVEEALLAHPSVGECAVVAASDADRGTIVKAFIVLAAGETGDDAMTKSLQDFTKARIAPYKYPRSIAYLDALPKTQTGKIQRFALRGT